MTNPIPRIKTDIALRQTVIFIGGNVSLQTINDQESHRLWLMETLVTENRQLIQAIGELDCPILTSNYDLHLEEVLDRKPLTWNSYQPTDSNLNESILHLFGCVQEPDSMIFTSDDYEQIRHNDNIASKMRAIIENKTLLFIGYGPSMFDGHFSNLLTWLNHVDDHKSLSIYKLVQFNGEKNFNRPSNSSFLENIKEISFGTTPDDLLAFIKSLQSFIPIIRQGLLSNKNKEIIRNKYLTYLIQEYGHVSILGYSNNNINLPLESVYVELKFDPTHPSIKAMKTLEIQDEFKRQLLSPGFFDEDQKRQLNQAIIERNGYTSEHIYRDFMIDQWLTVLLSNRKIFTIVQAVVIEEKIQRLKQSIMYKNNFQETRQYRIQQAYNEFKHFIILGHPGSGKTTLSKWLVTNMAKGCLGEENMLFNDESSMQNKIPVLIPIWKYVDQTKQTHDQRKISLLQLISENPTFDSPFFNHEERNELSLLMMESLIQGNVLVIFEGLDEVPAHIDRSDLMKEINTLLERGIDYDVNSQQLIYSIYEQKEINNVKNPHIGNRFIITSRIEGNYFEDINFYIPRLTIENMSNEALRLFCSSYMQCIRQMSDPSDQLYNDISQNKDIFQLAINPQLASIIVGLYNQCEGRLPEKRIDLYEKAIETMIERLVTPTSHLSAELELNSTMLWSILQEIADYLHSKVEGLSERVLKQIIRRCLTDRQQQPSDMNDLISKLVNIFKYQAGLLNEFGHNSFRFIHRTFQEYLAAKSTIYWNGRERSEQTIYENIMSKIGIPNWRVPLSMTFGILSRSMQHSDLFNNIIRSLLRCDSISSNTQFSNALLPFVVIDSLNDMSFSSNEIEERLVRNLADLLLMDYQNMSGFARLKEHQDLIHSYFSKLKQKYDQIMLEWFIDKLENPKNLASCANIIHQLKWYKSKFHEIFLKNLHNDSTVWNWSIDSLLRFYSKEFKYNAVLRRLKFKRSILQHPQIIQRITLNEDWLCLIIALYGGYTNHNTPKMICEYYEIAQYLNLDNNERAPFVFYYQEAWGRDDPAYNMAVHLDTAIPKHLWSSIPIFTTDEIYKESFLTHKILELLFEEKLPSHLIEWLRSQIDLPGVNLGDQIEILIALIILGDFDFLRHVIKKRKKKKLIKSLTNRIEQLISVLKDSIARWSSIIPKYLSAVHQHPTNVSKLKFFDYCQIYFSLTSDSGGLPIDTKTFANQLDDRELQNDLYAEYFAFKLTAGNPHGDLKYEAACLLDKWIKTSKSKQIIKSFLKISDAIQCYRPVRAYPWPTDRFIFNSNDNDDIPIAFFNCLENINTNISFLIEGICNVFFEEGYLNKNIELIPLILLLHFGMMSSKWSGSAVYDKWIPEFVGKTNIKEFILEKIQSMRNPYYKSRALCQLAEFQDERSLELLTNSFQLAQEVPQPVRRFQVLEKMFSMIHYKTIDQRSFLQQIVDQLISTWKDIENTHDRVIASIRLSFYGSGEFRYKYIAYALQTLIHMNQDDQQIKLIIKIQPLIALYDDLHVTLNEFIRNLVDKTHRYQVHSHYGRILAMNKFKFDTDIDFKRLQALFSLFAQLNDVKSIIGETETLDQQWINLFKDPHNQSCVEKILEIGLKNEFFLTPQVAIILDELVRQGKEDCISVLFPYIIKPSNEVLPVVQRWMTDYHNKPIGRLAALLLTEAKHVFESAVDILVGLLENENDQLRYRVQRVFQHPERDVREPSKRISVIGEKALIHILLNIEAREHPLRIKAYLHGFFYDVLWDDPQAFQNLYNYLNGSNGRNGSSEKRLRFFHKIKFIDDETWNAIMRSLEWNSDPLYVEEILQSAMRLSQNNRITVDNWTAFATVLAATDTTRFRERLYFSRADIEVIQFIFDEVCALTDACDETYFEILESKLISALTVSVDDFSRSTLAQINQIRHSNFCASDDLNNAILNILHDISLTSVILENLIKWLIQKLANLKTSEDIWYSFMLSDCLLSLVSACAQKDGYLYRKVTNSPHFNKHQMITLLERMIHHHSFFPARGSAFILLAALDQTEHKVIINALSTLFDENVVKEYAMIGIPLIHLSPNELLDDLLSSLASDSAVKVYEILKILTQFALNEQIDAKGKS